jgi:hypothetical protein
VCAANALAAAKRYDPEGSALGMALFASVMVEDEEQAKRTVVALVMLKLALELDPHLATMLKWH